MIKVVKIYTEFEDVMFLLRIKGKKYEKGLIFEDKKNLKKYSQKYMNFEILITRLEKRVQCIFHWIEEAKIEIKYSACIYNKESM